MRLSVKKQEKDFLGELGHEVSVIELCSKLGADVISEHKKFLMKALNEYGVHEITGAKVTEFYDDGASGFCKRSVCD